VRGSVSTPLLWTEPETQAVVGFDMLLRDEPPPQVRAALRTAIGSP
jgi:hypothetical protein